MAQKLTPARGIRPGVILRREMYARGWTTRTLAERMGRPTEEIGRLLSGEQPISAETADRLAVVFGTSADFWRNLERNFRLVTFGEPST